MSPYRPQKLKEETKKATETKTAFWHGVHLMTLSMFYWLWRDYYWEPKEGILIQTAIKKRKKKEKAIIVQPANIFFFFCHASHQVDEYVGVFFPCHKTRFCGVLRSERGAGAAAADSGWTTHGARRHAGGHRGPHQVIWRLKSEMKLRNKKLSLRVYILLWVHRRHRITAWQQGHPRAFGTLIQRHLMSKFTAAMFHTRWKMGWKKKQPKMRKHSEDENKWLCQNQIFFKSNFFFFFFFFI